MGDNHCLAVVVRKNDDRRVQPIELSSVSQYEEVADIVNSSDFSPPSSPTVDQQRDALAKGLGRAMQWANAGALCNRILLEACLEDLRYDCDVEDARGDWLWGLVQARGMTADFRVPILHGLYALSNKRSAHQLCQLGLHYAQGGDQTFRQRLYDIVEKKPLPEYSWLAENEVMQLDRVGGFIFAARVRGVRLESTELDWHDKMLVERATELFGVDQVTHGIDASADPAVRRLLEAWREDKRQRSTWKPPDREAHIRSIPASEIIAEAATESACGTFRGWGMRADEASLNEVLQYLWSVRDPSIIANLLKVLGNRPLPEFDYRLVELCQQANASVRARALTALAMNAHARIREFSLNELTDSARVPDVVRLFVRNYRRGDEHRILEALQLPADPFTLHGLLSDAIDILKANREADCTDLGVVAYAATPCSLCRFHAVRLLNDRRVSPRWLIEECKLDCDWEIRRLVNLPPVR